MNQESQVNLRVHARTLLLGLLRCSESLEIMVSAGFSVKTRFGWARTRDGLCSGGVAEPVAISAIGLVNILTPVLFDYFVECESHQFPPSWDPNNFHAEGSVRLLKFSSLAVLQLILVVSLPLAVMQTLAIADSVEIYQRDVLPILQSHCLQCHGADVSKADLRIDTVEPVFQGASGERWHDILNRVEVGDMPPEDAEPLSTEARRKLSRYQGRIQNALQQDGEQNSPIVRRLNRIEYNNTLTELTGIRRLHSGSSAGYAIKKWFQE